MSNTKEASTEVVQAKETPRMQPVVKAAISYPIINSEKVIIKRKITTANLPEMEMATNTAEDYMFYVGPAFENFRSGKLLGRTIFDYADNSFEEEKRIMSRIISTDPKDIKWNESLDEYWHSLYVFIPFNGLEIEVGKVYSSENEWVPIDYANFVLYLYVKKYYRVANNVADMDKSRNIWFYLWTTTEDRKTKATLLDLEDRAFALRKTLEANLDSMNAVLRLSGKSPQPSVLDAKVTIAELAKTSLHQFIEIAEDKDLLRKDLVQRAINKGLLIQPVNTTLVMWENNTIGHSLGQAAAWLDDPINATVKATILSKLNPKL